MAEAGEFQLAKAKMQVQLLRRTRLLREGNYDDPLRDPDFDFSAYLAANPLKLEMTRKTGSSSGG